MSCAEHEQVLRFACERRGGAAAVSAGWAVDGCGCERAVSSQEERGGG